MKKKLHMLCGLAAFMIVMLFMCNIASAEYDGKLSIKTVVEYNDKEENVTGSLYKGETVDLVFYAENFKEYNVFEMHIDYNSSVLSPVKFTEDTVPDGYGICGDVDNGDYIILRVKSNGDFRQKVCGLVESDNNSFTGGKVSFTLRSDGNDHDSFTSATEIARLRYTVTGTYSGQDPLFSFTADTVGGSFLNKIDQSTPPLNVDTSFSAAKNAKEKPDKPAKGTFDENGKASWTSVQGLTYNLFYYKNGTGTGTEYTNKTSGFAFPSDLSLGSYNFTVQAEERGYKSDESDMSDAFIRKEPLAKPTNLSITNDVLTWNAVTNATKYNYVVKNSQDQPIEGLSGSVESASLNLADLISDVGTYKVCISAASSDTNYAESDVAEKEYKRIKKLSAPVLTLTDSTLSWSAVDNAAKYGYEIKNSSNALIQNGSGTVEALSLDLTGKFTIPGAYTVYIKSLPADDAEYYTESAASNKEYVYSVQLGKPTVIINGALDTASWSEVTNADKYKVVINKKSDGSQVNEKTVSTTSFKLSDLITDDGIYLITVTAINSANDYYIPSESETDVNVKEYRTESTVSGKATVRTYNPVCKINYSVHKVHVSVINSSQQVVKEEDISDAQLGEYQIKGVEKGNYTVKFEKVSCVTKTKTVTVNDCEPLTVEEISLLPCDFDNDGKVASGDLSFLLNYLHASKDSMSADMFNRLNLFDNTGSENLIDTVELNGLLHYFDKTE